MCVSDNQTVALIPFQNVYVLVTVYLFQFGTGMVSSLYRHTDNIISYKH